jgi:two-component system, NtrC family, nitrogen regulation sensor histidine kinase NtrY
MPMAATEGQPERRKTPWILGIFVFGSFIILLLLQASNLWKDFSVETAGDTILLYALSSLNFFAFVIFGFIFLRSILKLARERRALQLGARIKTRLLVYFAALSLLPIIAMAGFSYLFMNRAIERWFSQIPENVLHEVRDRAEADQAAKLNESAKMLAAAIGGREVDDAFLERLREAGGLTYVELFSSQGTVARSSTSDPNAQAELVAAVNRVKAGDAPNTRPRKLDIVVAELDGGRRLLIVPEELPGESLSLVVEGSLIELDRLKAEQIKVRQLGFLTLGVLTFLLIFASMWTAFFVARGLTVPIKALAEGADEIAHGNLAHRVETIAEDELELLVSAFNQMTARLEANSAEIGERRRYIETVLLTLPTGVISFDSADKVSTINPAARKMLNLEDADFVGLGLDKLVSQENRLVLERIVHRARRIGHAADQTEIVRERSDGSDSQDATLPVAVTASKLDEDGGVVLVLEDLAELIAAQRASAWREVARRMAHEIKNPLTPIQLSAERIAKRFGDGGPDPSSTNGQTSQVVMEGTETIIREVQALKAMVDEFSRFARLPNAKPEPGDLNDIVRTVLALYEDRLDRVRIDAVLAEMLPAAMLDPEQIKRVFVNLIDNAIEAFDELQENRTISVATRHDEARDILVVEVSDNGKGIAPREIQKLFQPYFSTKGRGTGLGLAIVKRIITEHHGRIMAAANQPRGARFIIELPV